MLQSVIYHYDAGKHLTWITTCCKQATSTTYAKYSKRDYLYKLTIFLHKSYTTLQMCGGWLNATANSQVSMMFLKWTKRMWLAESAVRSSCSWTKYSFAVFTDKQLKATSTCRMHHILIQPADIILVNIFKPAALCQWAIREKIIITSRQVSGSPHLALFSLPWQQAWMQRKSE